MFQPTVSAGEKGRTVSMAGTLPILTSPRPLRYSSQ